MLKYFSYFFPENRLDIEMLFHVKNKKNKNLSSVEFTQGVLRVNQSFCSCGRYFWSN